MHGIRRIKINLIQFQQLAYLMAPVGMKVCRTHLSSLSRPRTREKESLSMLAGPDMKLLLEHSTQYRIQDSIGLQRRAPCHQNMTRTDKNTFLTDTRACFPTFLITIGPENSIVPLMCADLFSRRSLPTGA